MKLVTEHSGSLVNPLGVGVGVGVKSLSLGQACLRRDSVVSVRLAFLRGELHHAAKAADRRDRGGQLVLEV